MTNALFSQDKIFSVSELNGLIKEILEGSFPEIKLEGEISNFRPNASGHLYFNLKDSEAVISAVMFKYSALHLDFKPKDGMKVQVQGKLSVYSPQGKYQIVITKMTVSGEGAILQKIEELKRKFAAEGLFDEERKKPLPLFPETIGVVTSATGAAVRDIIQITQRRNKCVSVVVFPSLVQGEGAAENIARQIEVANAKKLCNVLIVGRGGGSVEDLLPFSEEVVIRAIANSKIPVVSAVGHEIDWALSDFVADKRAATPSAAAELCVPQYSDIMQTINFHYNELVSTISAKMERIKLMVKNFSPDNFETMFRSIEEPLLMRFDNAKDDLFDNIFQRLKDSRQKVQSYIMILERTNPLAILERGYSLVYDKETNALVTDAEKISKGKTLKIVPAKGRLEAVVV